MKNLALRPSVIIPTLNAAGQLKPLLEMISHQRLQPLQTIVIDSTSDDDTVAIAKESGCLVEVIPREAFNHGWTRNKAAGLAEGDILVFLSQDACPKDESFLEKLVRPIHEGQAVAVMGRQVPYPEADPLESYARLANYPAESHVRTKTDIESMGVMAYFFSNAASAIRKDVIEAVGGFPEYLVVNEDMMLCATLLHAGYFVAYNAEAEIYHSHSYGLREQFQRYFDIGIFFKQAKDHLGGVRPEVRGVRFALGQIRHLMKEGTWFWIPRSALESLLKFLGFTLGNMADGFPLWLKRGLSRQKTYWDQVSKPQLE